jgi:hypothetical protein
MNKEFYNALFYDANLNRITKISINREFEYQYLCELLKCKEIDLIEHPKGFSIIMDGTGFFKQVNKINIIEGIENPIAGNAIIAGLLNNSETLDSLNKNITDEYVLSLIKPFAEIIPVSDIAK